MPYLPELLILLQILLIDLSMAGDNALVVGMAAAGLPTAKRHVAVIGGIIGATVLRVVFAVFAVKILHITGVLAAGGLLLLWVTWKMYEELRHIRRISQKELRHPRFRGNDVDSKGPKTLASAIWQIIVADVSMSLDNVLGVAGVAREHIGIMAIGLVLSVVLMGLASTLVAKLAARHNWISYVGLGVVFFTALKMVWDGAEPFLR
jgi:YjbE family integral membrane protein